MNQKKQKDIVQIIKNKAFEGKDDNLKIIKNRLNINTNERLTYKNQSILKKLIPSVVCFILTVCIAVPLFYSILAVKYDVKEQSFIAQSINPYAEYNNPLILVISCICFVFFLILMLVFLIKFIKRK